MSKDGDEIFCKISDVIDYLQNNGWYAAKTTVYRHFEQEFLQMSPKGFLKEDVDEYAMTHLTRKPRKKASLDPDGEAINSEGTQNDTSLDEELEEIKATMIENQEKIKTNLRAQLLTLACQMARIDGRRHTRTDIAKIYSALCESVGRDDYVSPQTSMQIEEEETVDRLLTRFVCDRCDLGMANKITSTDLYECFCEWYLLQGYKILPSQTWLGKLMSKRFAKVKHNGVNTYRGISIRK